MNKFKQLKNSALLSIPVLSLAAINSFASQNVQLPTLTAEQLNPIVTAFNTYSGVILPVGIGFIAVKTGIRFIPRLIGMLFK